jgi:threonine/homoserine/homoserine lactone efflux protein
MLTLDQTLGFLLAALPITAPPRAGLWLDRVAGMVFIGLGLRRVVAR